MHINSGNTKDYAKFLYNQQRKKEISIEHVDRILSKYFSPHTENEINDIIFFFNHKTLYSINYIFDFFYSKLETDNVKTLLSNDDVEHTITTENEFIIFKSYNKKNSKNIDGQVFKRHLSDFLSVDINNGKLSFYFKNYNNKNKIGINLSTNFYYALKNGKASQYNKKIYNYISEYINIKKRGLVNF